MTVRSVVTTAAVLLLAACSDPAGDASDPPPSSLSPTVDRRSPEPTATPGSPADPGSAPAPSSSPARTPATRDASAGSWQVGARVLPTRPDGYGVMRRTPPELRVRRLPTEDVLPPPRGDRFRSSVAPVTPRLAGRTDLAWSPGCPVDLADLRYLRMSFRGFDGEPHTGEMVVNGSVAGDVLDVFRRLYDAGYPIEQMRLVTRADLDAPPTGDGNNTAAYACRPAVGTTSWSAHAYGLAIDVNPFVNPYTRGDCPPDGPRDLGCVLLPELASAYLDRDWRRPGMVHRGDLVWRAFRDIGWTWGGDFRTLQDRHHFSATGR